MLDAIAGKHLFHWVFFHVPIRDFPQLKHSFIGSCRKIIHFRRGTHIAHNFKKEEVLRVFAT
jgi:hypothetical protein